MLVGRGEENAGDALISTFKGLWTERVAETIGVGTRAPCSLRSILGLRMGEDFRVQEEDDCWGE